MVPSQKVPLHKQLNSKVVDNWHRVGTLFNIISLFNKIKNSNMGSAKVVSWCSGFLIPATDNTTSKKKK